MLAGPNGLPAREKKQVECFSKKNKTNGRRKFGGNINNLGGTNPIWIYYPTRCVGHSFTSILLKVYLLC